MNTMQRAGVIALVHANPSLTAWLESRTTGREVPPFARAEVYKPGGAKVDGTSVRVVFRDHEGAVVHTNILTIPQGRDAGAPARWARDAAEMETMFGVPCQVVVLMPDDRNRRWYEARTAAYNRSRML